MYLKDGKVQPGLSINGPLAAAIPGLPAALDELAARYGKLPLKSTLAPAIRLANQGFAVDRIYRDRAEMRLAAMRDDPETARLFLDNGHVPAAGTVIRQPELAETLQHLADHGRDGFYRGPVAATLVKEVKGSGGIWSLDDLSGYRVVEREPLRELVGQLPALVGVQLVR